MPCPALPHFGHWSALGGDVCPRHHMMEQVEICMLPAEICTHLEEDNGHFILQGAHKSQQWHWPREQSRDRSDLVSLQLFICYYYSEGELEPWESFPRRKTMIKGVFDNHFVFYHRLLDSTLGNSTGVVCMRMRLRHFIVERSNFLCQHLSTAGSTVWSLRIFSPWEAMGCIRIGSDKLRQWIVYCY